MRKLLLTGLLAAVLLAPVSVGCGSPSPAGPGTVTVTQTTTSTTTTTIPTTTSTTTSVPSTTTTSVPPATTAARRFVAFRVPPNDPSDMTLFYQLLGGSAVSSLSSFFASLRALVVPEFVYSVQGVYASDSGIGGAVKGELGGGVPLDAGIFDGTLTAELPGCTAERAYTGPLTSQGLQWTAGRILRDCPSSLLWPLSFTMIRGDSVPPPVTTTSIPSAR